jgi:4-amino-4-deoxy-L-arabinose transferase-like glycosyltransferase
LSGLVLLSAPYWSLLSHQSMTDMPYVAPMTAALALFGLGQLTEPTRRAPALELLVGDRRLRISGFHLLFLLIVATSLPQLVYLISRNVTLQVVAPPYGFRWHFDELFSGSGGGNCGLPGNESCHGVLPANAMFQPALGALLFGAALGYLVHLNRGERRLQRLYYLGAWYCTALSALAKGAPGLVLPVVIAITALVAARSWQQLTRVELAGFCLILACVCLPWYVQSYMRHGEPFTDRLLFHDMYKRAFVHVHDTNSGSDVSFRYYLWQLGYGAFPWSGVAAAGLALALQHTQGANQKLQSLAALSVLWLVVSFGMFSVSLTKFHHYALPCLPPLAVCAGLILDRAFSGLAFAGARRLALYLGALLSAALLMLYGASRLSAGTALGSVGGDGTLAPASHLAAAAFMGLGLALAWLAARRLSRNTAEPEPMLGVLAVGAGLFSLLVARDLSTTVLGDVPASARLLHLITYNYKRSWPASLDFQASHWAFGCVVALTCFALSSRKLRPHAVVLSCGVGVWFCVYTLMVYLPRVAPHFGQRELFLTYYRVRQNEQQPVVAYQMNWKGENFYTGNRLPAFVSSGSKFKAWLKAQHKLGTRVLFFVTEHGRIGTLKSELGPTHAVTPLTNKLQNDKFALVRVELDGASRTEAAPDTEQEVTD